MRASVRNGVDLPVTERLSNGGPTNARVCLPFRKKEVHTMAPGTRLLYRPERRVVSPPRPLGDYNSVLRVRGEILRSLFRSPGQGCLANPFTGDWTEV